MALSMELPPFYTFARKTLLSSVYLKLVEGRWLTKGKLIRQ
jgi:hypothetical protein